MGTSDPMTVSKPASGEYEPLLTATPKSYIAVAADEAAQDENGMVPVRKWEGGLVNCCGSCDQVGWGSCLLSRYLPCVAFGQNMKRALRQSAWVHGFLYLALLLGASWFAIGTLVAAQHNVLASCNGQLPEPHHHHPGWLAEPESRGLWSSFDPEKFDALIDGDHSKHHKHDHEDDDGDDDAHSKPVKGDKHKHSHDDDEGDNSHDGDDSDNNKELHKEKPCKKKAKQSKAVAPEGIQQIADQAAVESSFRSMGSFSNVQALPKGPEADSDPPHPPHPPHPHPPSPECQAAITFYFGAWVVLGLSILLFVTYAARRRTQLRQQFGIAGSKLDDFCTWCWCAPCALCQETRTLWTNNVQEGVWHGPTKYVAVSAVPAPQFMSSEA